MAEDKVLPDREENLNKNEILQKLNDLKLINSVNIAINSGKSLDEIIKLISVETKKLFYGSGTAVYLISDDGKYLIMQRLNISSAKIKKIEQMIKIKIPEIKISLEEGSYYYKVIKKKRAGNSK